MSIVFAILLFSFLIFIHELGHFVAAKLSGVRVNEFSMFMGPAIVKWERGETKYSIRCIPIGGYCAMEGEDQESEDPRAFGNARWWKRLIILVAGSFMNFLTGVLIVAVVLFCQPRYTSNELAAVEQWSSLSQTLQAGDRILELDGKPIRIYEDFFLNTLNLEDGEYDMVIDRDGKKLRLENVPVQTNTDPVDGSQRYGISFANKDTTAASVPGRIWPTVEYNVKAIFVSLQMLFNGQAGLKDLSGPVGIVAIMSETAQSIEDKTMAFLSMLNMGGFIAINLAVMNMLPIPALDGGRTLGLLLTTAIEKITKKKLNPKYEGYVHGIGMLLLLAFMAFILFKDVFTIFKR